jgi:hypothetical protein
VILEASDGVSVGGSGGVLASVMVRLFVRSR